MIREFDAKEKNNVDNAKFFRILSVVIFFIFTFGIAFGSVYCVRCASASDEINSRFYAIFDYITSDCPKLNVAVNQIIEHGVICAAVIFAAHFKHGYFLPCAAALREGFISGFTLSAAVSAYGAMGLLAMGTIIVETLFTSAALIMLCAASAAFSVSGEKNFKKLLIIFSVCAISIFCGAAFFRGYISTTFIKIIYSKIL